MILKTGFGPARHTILPVSPPHTSEKNPHPHMFDFIYIIDVDKRRKK